MTNKDLILGLIEDLAVDFLYCNRKDDEQLSSKELLAAIGNNEVTIEEIAECFRLSLEECICLNKSQIG